MKNLNKVIAVVLAVAMLFSLVACGKRDEKIDALVVGTMSSIEKATRGEYNYDVLGCVLTQMALVSVDENGNPIPQLANFKTKDSKTWEYTIKKGHKWQDGVDLTGEDVIFTLNYLDENEGKSYFKGENAAYEKAFLSPDKMTVTLVLKDPNIKAANNLSTVSIIPKHIYEGKKMAEVSDADSRIGCGAYKFEKFDKNAGTVSFVANKDYIDSAPNVERVIFKTFSNNDTMYLALSHGELDMLYTYSMGITPIAIETLSKNENITLQAITATNAPAVLGFNNSIAPFDDVNMRQAVKYAIDYEKFKELFSSKYGSTPQECFVPKGLVGYVETAPLKRDLTKAKEFLKLCGYDDSDIVNGYHTKNGKKLSFVLTVNGKKETQVRYGELVKENLKEIGIDVVLEAIDDNAYKAKTSNKFSENNPTHQAAIFGYTAAGMSMMSGLGTIYIDGTHTVQGGARVFDSEFKQIVVKMSKAKTLDEYKMYAKECVDYYAKNVPVIALFLDSSVQAYNKKLSGFTVDGNYGLLNYKTWQTIEMAK